MDDPRFKSSSLDELLAHHALTHDLLNSLNLESADDAAAYQPAYAALTGALATAFADQISPARKSFKPMRGAQGAAQARVFRHYLEFLKHARGHYGGALSAVSLSNEAWPDSIRLEVLGNSGSYGSPVYQPDAALRAYYIARVNLGQAKARCATLEYLAAQLPENVQATAAIDLALSGLYTCLSTRYVMHQSTVLKFAMLLGGQALDETRQEVLTHMFGPRKPVREYLIVDGGDSTSVGTADEAAFRASIASYAKRTIV